MRLDDLIEYESENTNLDFKAQEYGQNKEALIKDIMSMANAHTNDKKYIIVGVKDSPNEARKIIGLDNISDQAVLENVIQENIEPIIHFKYYKYKYEEKNLGIIEIDSNTDKPYKMKKDNGSLKKGDAWIRKGSRQSRVVREDIDWMLKNRSNFLDFSKIKIGIDDNFKKEHYVEFPVINYEEKPSNIEKKRLEECLEKLKSYKEMNFLDGKPFTIKGYNEYLSESNKIKIGRDFIGLPIYCSEEEILERIKKLPVEYDDEDYYFLLEENSLKLNFSIYNDTNQFLEDVKIEFKITKDCFFVAETLPEKQQYDHFGVRIPSFAEGYPSVNLEDSYYVVTEYFDNIRHKDLIKVFSEDLRCCKIRENTEKETSIKYKISANNLENPINGSLVLKWE